MVKLSRPRAPAVFRALFPGLADWLESPWAGPPQFTAAQSSARPDGGFGQRKVRLDLVAVAAAVFVPQLPGLSHLHPKFRDQLIAFGDQLPQPGVRGPQPGNRVSQSGRLTGHKERIGHTPHSTTAGPSVIKSTRRAGQRQSPQDRPGRERDLSSYFTACWS